MGGWQCGRNMSLGGHGGYSRGRNMSVVTGSGSDFNGGGPGTERHESVVSTSIPRPETRVVSSYFNLGPRILVEVRLILESQSPAEVRLRSVCGLIIMSRHP